MRSLICQDAAPGLAASNPVASSVSGTSWRDDSRAPILQCGIALEPSGEKNIPRTKRQSLGLPDGGKVLRHLVQLDEHKNHESLLQISRQKIQAQPATRLGIAEWKVFACPRGRKRLPHAVLEARATGLPVLMSDRVTEKACAVSGQIQRLPFEQEGPWVHAYVAAPDGAYGPSGRVRVLRSPRPFDLRIGRSIPLVEEVQR